MEIKCRIFSTLYKLCISNYKTGRLFRPEIYALLITYVWNMWLSNCSEILHTALTNAQIYADLTKLWMNKEDRIRRTRLFQSANAIERRISFYVVLCSINHIFIYHIISYIYIYIEPDTTMVAYEVINLNNLVGWY